MYLNWGAPEIVQLTLILFVQMLACYAFLYFLLPRFFYKSKYFLFAISIAVLTCLIIQITQWIIYDLIPLIGKVHTIQGPAHTKRALWAGISEGGINFLKVVAIATGIKIGKSAWYKQKEKERLEKEKIDTELELMKAQIHPAFLFNTLKNIQKYCLEYSPKAPGMLLKLSDILSYMLYECNEPEVSLEKEIKMLRDYSDLEKMRLGKKLEINIEVRGSLSNEYIAPLLLFYFIEHSFKQSANAETAQPWINFDLKVENHILEMKLMNGKPSVKIADLADTLSQVEKRLQLIYTDRYTLNISDEPEIQIVHLEIKLKTMQTKSSVVNTDYVEEQEEQFTI